MIPQHGDQFAELLVDAASAGGRFCCGPRHRGEEPPPARVACFLADSLRRIGFGGCCSGRSIAADRPELLVAPSRPSNGFFRDNVGPLLRVSCGRAGPKTGRTATDPAGLAAGPQLLGPLRRATWRTHRDVDPPSPHRRSPLRLLAHNHRNALRITHADHPCVRRAFVCTRGGRLLHRRRALAGRQLREAGCWGCRAITLRTRLASTTARSTTTDRNVDDQIRAKRRRYWCS
jgi:hypothetical protein